ncbi:MAG: hypothetical protein ABIK92_21855 [Pseudomonadota bacterium]|uniref:Uncharacterized protein n=1 Tax=viral metagenome TaxID=1070528 RepID=A0A6M3L466_9ZZZZ
MPGNHATGQELIKFLQEKGLQDAEVYIAAHFSTKQNTVYVPLDLQDHGNPHYKITPPNPAQAEPATLSLGMWACKKNNTGPHQ